MATKLEQILVKFPRSTITDLELYQSLDGSMFSCYNRIKRAVNQKLLIRIRRGLYCINPKWSGKKSHPYHLAAQIYAPSYISLESALSYHGLIPEAVYTTTSVSIKRSKTFKTPIGVFSYQRIPKNNFYVGVERVKQNSDIFFMATPLKALADFIYCYKKDWTNILPLTENLRIEIDDLKTISLQDKMAVEQFYKNRRVTNFLNGLQQELKS